MDIGGGRKDVVEKVRFLLLQCFRFFLKQNVKIFMICGFVCRNVYLCMQSGERILFFVSWNKRLNFRVIFYRCGLGIIFIFRVSFWFRRVQRLIRRSFFGYCFICFQVFIEFLFFYSWKSFGIQYLMSYYCFQLGILCRVVYLFFRII